MTVVPQCFTCKHLNPGHSMSCAAFPHGIPEDIEFGRFDHTQSHAGDNGIRYEKKIENDVDTRRVKQ